MLGNVKTINTEKELLTLRTAILDLPATSDISTMFYLTSLSTARLLTFRAAKLA